MKRNVTKAVLLGSLCVIVAACGGGGGGGSSEDWGEGIAEVEPNNSSGAAQTITAGVTINGTGNSVTDDTDLFKFVPTETKIYTIKLGDMGANDFDLFVNDESLMDLGYSDIDAPDDGPTEIIQVTLGAGVTYYIEVFTYNTGGADGSYRLKIE